MCISIRPARLTNTILLAHSIVRPDGTPINILGYQNSAKTIGPNAMLLPIPAKALTSANCVDMSKSPDIFKEYKKLIESESNSRGLVSRGICFSGPEVFDSGSYTVILAPRAAALSAYLEQVPAAKRPTANPELFAQMDVWYPDFYFALCCWDGTMDAEPMVWWYEPLDAYKDHHFLPGLDAHDGGLPELEVPVDVDHTIIVGRPEPSLLLGGNAVQLASTVDPNIRQYMPNHVWGATFGDEMRNGDWRIKKGGRPRDDLQIRVSPPGA